jgi:threonine/homoserine/homoserine lactone efflux protein
MGLIIIFIGLKYISLKFSGVEDLIEILLFTATSFAVGLSGALVPGPMLTVTISDSLNKGFIAGPMIVIGHFIAELSIILLIFAGLEWFISSATAVLIIGTLGGFMMLIMGYRIIGSNPLNEIKENKGICKSYGPVLSGILTSLSNPFFFIWWATIGWAFMFKGLELAGILGVLGFLIGHWTSDMGWFSLVSFFTSRGSNVMTEKYYKIIMNISGVFLMILGAYFVLNAQKII